MLRIAECSYTVTGLTRLYIAVLSTKQAEKRQSISQTLTNVLIGDENTPITAMVRHYDRLLAFKVDSAYSINYDVLTLSDSSVIAGFFLKNVNKVIGNTPLGMAQIVENSPFTLDGTSIYRWAATSTSGNVTGDQRNAQRISQRIETTLRDFVFDDTVTFYDKIAHEYYAVYGDTAVVQNTENDTWYVFEDFPATCMVVYDGYVYFGTPDGYVRKMSRAYLNDNGDSIDAYWESGSMDFGADYRLKSSDCVYIGLKPETGRGGHGHSGNRQRYHFHRHGNNSKRYGER